MCCFCLWYGLGLARHWWQFPLLAILFVWKILWCLHWLTCACDWLMGWYFICLLVALPLSSFFTICLILQHSNCWQFSNCLARNSWSCMPDRNITLDRVLVVSWGYPHGASCLFTLLCHLYTLEPAYLNDFRRLYLALRSSACGLKNSSHFDHNISIDISLIPSTKLGTFLNLDHLTIWEGSGNFFIWQSNKVLLLVCSHTWVSKF